MCLEFLRHEGDDRYGDFRVRYTARFNADLASARIVQDPSGICTDCHTLSTEVTGRRFAADAVGKLPVVMGPADARLTTI